MADAPRPDPDALLAQVNAAEAAAKRGRLRVFFGAAAGVGKTYAMLSAAREKACEGVDVVIGYAEPHNRPETESLTLGLEILPPRLVEYRGALLREFNLDAALARKAELILVDELAHTNAPGSRHAKRWQDVQELLDAGMDVYTTVNVQHLESQTEAVAQSCGIVVRETLPDAIFDAADEVELIDLPPNELLERLRDGKIYEPRQAELALTGFFKKSNLSTLRELSLRKTADRVGDQALSARREEDPRALPGGRERLLVGVTGTADAARIVRAGKRLATALRAKWTVVFVETPDFRRAGAAEREALEKTLALADRQGARVITVPGLDAAHELSELAKSEGATRIIVGRPAKRSWGKNLLGSGMAQRLAATGAEVHTVPVEAQTLRRPKPQDLRWSAALTPTLRETAMALLAVGVCSGICAAATHLWPAFSEANLIMIYLAGVATVAARAGRVPATAAAVFSVLAFDFLFVPPRFSFSVSDGQYLLTFFVMLGVALLMAMQTDRIRAQVLASRERERRTDALLRMTTELAACDGLKPALDTAASHLSVVFGVSADILLPDPETKDGAVRLRASSDGRSALSGAEAAVARWVRQNARPAGRGTDTLPGSESLFVPMAVSGRVVGVAGFRGEGAQDLLDPAVGRHLLAMVGQVALSVERAQFAAAAREEAAKAEAERLRSTLLSSVSHDLRTPLSVIIGSSEELLGGAHPEVGALAQTIRAEATRLDRLVGDLLDITRLEAGGINPGQEILPVEEIVGAALSRPLPELEGRPVAIRIPADLPMIRADGVLVGQALLHLLENAGKYTPTGTPVEVEAAVDGPFVAVSVLDRGPGLGEGEAEKIFGKFFRGGAATGKPGTGLGLAICRAIVEAHGGKVRAHNRAGGGTSFTLLLPSAPPLPRLETAP